MFAIGGLSSYVEEVVTCSVKSYGVWDCAGICRSASFEGYGVVSGDMSVFLAWKGSLGRG